MWHTCKTHLALENFNLREIFLNSLCQRLCSYYSSAIGIHLIRWQILKSSCFRLSSSPTDAHTGTHTRTWHAQKVMRKCGKMLCSSYPAPCGTYSKPCNTATATAAASLRRLQLVRSGALRLITYFQHAAYGACQNLYNTAIHTHAYIHIYMYIYYIDKYIAFIIRYGRAPEKKRQNFCLQLPENTKQKNRKVVIF